MIQYIKLPENCFGKNLRTKYWRINKIVKPARPKTHLSPEEEENQQFDRLETQKFSGIGLRK